MSTTVVALWAMFMLGAAGMYGVMKFSEEPLVLQKRPARKRAQKRAVLEKEIEETQEWVRTMRTDTGDIELNRYRYKWKKNPLLAIEAAAQRLMITAKPHELTEAAMASISRHMNRRPKTIGKPPIKKARLLAARRRQ